MPEVAVGRIDEIEEQGCREFSSGGGDWPFRGFVVRQNDTLFAYQNVCRHVGHPLNLQANRFLTRDGKAIGCASHGGLYESQTGVCVAGPCKGQALHKLPCSICDGVIFVTVPEGS
jgi:nitrite reductase/ring-hydroxylating ferredoxin subunit